MWTGNETLDGLRSKAAAMTSGTICVNIEQLNGFGRVLRVAEAIIEEAKERTTYPDKRISAKLLYALQDALKACGNMGKKLKHAPEELCGESLRYYRDGNMMCCTFGDFENLQESPAGFGETDDEAFEDLKRQIVCETCEGSGRVHVTNKWPVDRGTKFQRNFEEQVTDECPACNGVGLSR